MDLVDPLLATLQDPYLFLLLLFLYSVLVAVILPTPVEIALVPLLAQPAMWWIAAVTIGAGKAVGAGAIFLVGREAEKVVDKVTKDRSLVRGLTNLCVRFVAKTKYMGLYALLTLPFMSDTIPVYVYSLFNHQGELLSLPTFLFTNFLAGLNRAFLVLIAIVALGILLL